MNILPYSGFPALPKNIEDMHNQLVTLGLNDVEALTARIKKCEDWVDTVEETELTGNPVEFQNALAVPATSLVTTINAIQDLHGYDKPWVGGAGKNLLRYNAGVGSGAINEVYFTLGEDGTSWNINGVSTGVAVWNLLTGATASDFPSGTYVISRGIISNNVQLYIDKFNGTTRIGQITNMLGVESVTANIDWDGYDRVNIGFYINNNQTVDNLKVYPMIRKSTEPSGYQPYSNICPISGRDSVVVTRSDGDEISEDFTIQLGTTVYGADINWDTGVMTVTHANIASYDGETIGEPWISSMDEYTQGGTPTTGAQVVYPLATPTTIQLTPTQLEMLKGYNRVSSEDADSLTVKAYTGGPWEPITRATKKKAKTKKSKKGGN